MHVAEAMCFGSILVNGVAHAKQLEEEFAGCLVERRPVEQRQI